MQNRMMKRGTAILLTLVLAFNGFVLPERHQVQAQTNAASDSGEISPDLMEMMTTPGASQSDWSSITTGSSFKTGSGGMTGTASKIDTSFLAAVMIHTLSAPTSSLSSAIANNGGEVKRKYINLNMLAAWLPVDKVAVIASRSDVNYISLDRPTRLTGHLELTTGASLVRSTGTSTTGTINGTGIGIAVLDSGVYSAHHSFQNSRGISRVVASVDFTSGTGSPEMNCTHGDVYGHGTHVAAIAAGNSHVAQGAYTGIAPSANIINVRVLNSYGYGSTADTIAGIDWCIANKKNYNIRVMNLSLGTTAVDSYVNDALCKAARRAFNAGIVVVTAAGNVGKDGNGNKVFGGIHSPGIDPSVITVGAANTFGTDARSDDSVTTYSSRGPTRGYRIVNGVKKFDNLIKPDLIAPGNKLIEAKSPNNGLVAMTPALDASTSSNAQHGVMFMSGTSMSAPAVAGAAALLLQRNPGLTPNLVKAILQYTAQPISGFSTLEQGAGLLNVEAAVRLAGLVRADLSSLMVGAPMLTGAAPVPSSVIAGQSCVWSGGVIQNWNVLTGTSLMTKFQGIYRNGLLLSDGVIIRNGVLVADGVVVSDGVVVGDGVVVSDGTSIDSGTLIKQGVVLGDGMLLSDGVVISDGVVVSDGLLRNSLSAMTQAMSVLFSGEGTKAMVPVVDRETN